VCTGQYADGHHVDVFLNGYLQIPSNDREGKSLTGDYHWNDETDLPVFRFKLVANVANPDTVQIVRYSWRGRTKQNVFVDEFEKMQEPPKELASDETTLPGDTYQTADRR